jgi:hypothetical protein
MLTSINISDRVHALVLLRWLTYSFEPLTLEQLAEASIINPAEDGSSSFGSIDRDKKGHWEDTLHILTGLVVSVKEDQKDCTGMANTQRDHESVQGHGSSKIDRDTMIDDGVGELHLDQRASKTTKVRLAHFSVKEYLQSSRVTRGAARDFHLVPGREHSFLTQSCLAYLASYSRRSRKQYSNEDLDRSPLVVYAAQRWWDHAAEQNSKDNTREVRFLRKERLRVVCLSIYRPFDRKWQKIQGSADKRPALPQASFRNLVGIVQGLIAAGEDINGQDEDLGSALQAAAGSGHLALCRLLLDRQADIDCVGGRYGHALEAAAYNGHEAVVELLLAAGADVNIQGGWYNNALQAAACRALVAGRRSRRSHWTELKLRYYFDSGCGRWSRKCSPMASRRRSQCHHTWHTDRR